MSLTSKEELLYTLKNVKEEMDFLNHELRKERVICDTYKDIVAGILKTNLSPTRRVLKVNSAIQPLKNTIRQLDMDLLK